MTLSRNFQLRGSPEVAHVLPPLGASYDPTLTGLPPPSPLVVKDWKALFFFFLSTAPRQDAAAAGGWSSAQRYLSPLAAGTSRRIIPLRFESP